MMSSSRSSIAHLPYSKLTQESSDSINSIYEPSIPQENDGSLPPSLIQPRGSYFRKTCAGVMVIRNNNLPPQLTQPTGNCPSRNGSSLASGHTEAALQSQRQAELDLLSERVYDDKLFDVLRVDPDDFASQITLMDLQVFKRIDPEELTSCAWNGRAKLDKAYNVVQFIRRSNHTNFWVQKVILNAKCSKSRIDTMSLMIKVAKRLLELNNLNGLMAVVTALQSAPIYRLKSSWSGIPKRDRCTFNSLVDLMSEEENRRRLRDHLATTKLPCIPFLGIYLTDLIYIDTVHPHRGGLENNRRRNQMNNICRIISEFQQSTYGSLKPLKHVQNYLISVRYIEELQKFAEDDNYKLSLAIEPPETETQMATKDDCDEAQDSDVLSRPNTVAFNGHRKTLSDGVCSFASTMNVGRGDRKCQMKQKSILDGSVADDTYSAASSGGSLKLYKWLPGIQGQDCAIDKSDVKNILKGYMSPVLTKGLNQYGIDGLNAVISTETSYEGFVLRKRVLRGYRKPKFCPWRRLWMAYMDQHLLFFKLKTTSFFTTLLEQGRSRRVYDRTAFGCEPYKCYPISGRCMIVITDPPVAFLNQSPAADRYDRQKNELDQLSRDTEQSNKSVNEKDESSCNGSGCNNNDNVHTTFQLNDLSRGNIFKFQVRSSQEAQRWCTELRSAIQSCKSKLDSNNLISFE